MPPRARNLPGSDPGPADAPSLLAVALQHGPARDSEPRPVGLQAGKDREFILVRHHAAVPDDIAAAGALLLLGARIREGCGGNDRKSEGEREGSNHGVL